MYKQGQYVRKTKDMATKVQQTMGQTDERKIDKDRHKASEGKRGKGKKKKNLNGAPPPPPPQ